MQLARRAPAAKSKRRWIARAHRVGDSKAKGGFGRMRHIESLVLPLHDMDDLLAETALHGLHTLKAPCPRSPQRAFCFASPMALPAFGGDRNAGHAMLQACHDKDIEIASIKTCITCPRRLNDALSQGISKTLCDFYGVEDLIDAAYRSFAQPMIGGLRNYAKHFRCFDAVDEIHSARGIRTYRLDHHTTVSFEVHADATYPVVGKYLRELWMHRQQEYFRSQVGEIAQVSGYHDPKTRAFIDRARKVAEDCLIRQR